MNSDELVPLIKRKLEENSEVKEKLKTPVWFQQKKGDLFNESSSTSLAHCISQDIKLGAGIAKKFREIFGPKFISNIESQKVKVGGVAIYSDSKRFIYNLVTKKFFFDKPTNETLKQSLLEMKKHAISNNVKEISMPKIGCGLDKLKWSDVKNIIFDVFENSNIKIIVYVI